MADRNQDVVGEQCQCMSLQKAAMYGPKAYVLAGRSSVHVAAKGGNLQAEGLFNNGLMAHYPVV